MSETKTVVSSSTAYCTGAQAVMLFDVTIWGDLLQDTGDRVSAANVPTNTNLLAALMVASGEVEQAALKGGRYSVADLQSLQSPTMTAGGWFLARMVATLAMRDCTERRDPTVPMVAGLDRVYDSMDRLARGEFIFGFLQTQTAGLPAPLLQYIDMEDAKRSPVVKARALFGSHVYSEDQY